MRRWILCFSWILLGLGLRAQLWQSVGGGLRGNATMIWADNTEGLLYATGRFDSAAGHRPVCQIAAWDGVHWNKVGMAQSDSTCPYFQGYVMSMAKYQGDLFALERVCHTRKWIACTGQGNLVQWTWTNPASVR